MAGRSKAQINAIVKSIEDDIFEHYGRRPHRQGKALGGWVCLDYDSVVVNVFSEAQRQFYGIEKFWTAAQTLDLSDIVTPDAPEMLVSASSTDDDDDDWELGEDDDWDLSLDDDWSVGDDEATAEAVPFDFSADPAQARGDMMGAQAALSTPTDGDADPFAAFASEVVPREPLEVEATIATEEEEDAAERALVESGLLIAVDEDEDAGEDWAMGDEKLRAIVERAERAGSKMESTDWRSMMEEDGWDVENTIEDADADDEKAEDAFFA